MLTRTPKLDDMRKIIENRKKELGFTGIFKPKESGVIVHDLPPTIMEELEAVDQLAMDEDDTNYTQTPLLMSDVSDLYQEELGFKELKGGEVLPLVVLAREMRGDWDWSVPDKQLFLDLVAHLHSVTVRDAALNRTLEWNNF